MSVDELIPTIRALPRGERVRLMHLLVDDLTLQSDEGLTPGAKYDIWFPEANPGAVAAALRALEEDQGVR